MDLKIDIESGTIESKSAQKVRNSPMRTKTLLKRSKSLDFKKILHETGHRNYSEMTVWVWQLEAKVDRQVVPPLNRRPAIFGKWKSLDDFGASFLPETKKWEIVAYMKRWFGLNSGSFVRHMCEKEDEVWWLYTEVHEQFRAENSKRFIEHLLVNSCFLIFVMVILTKRGDLMDILSGRADGSNQWSEFNHLFFTLPDSLSVQQFMLTMEYQIPGFAIEALYGIHSNLKQRFDTTLERLILLCFDNFFPGKQTSKVYDTIPPSGQKHLLHFFHWSRSPEGKFNKSSAPWPLMKKMDSFYIPSATELQLSEIVFEKHPQGSINIHYSKRILSGVMQLAPWHLLPNSNQIYGSLLIFERKYGHICGYSFTAYVACMVCLLQTKEDVRLLRKKGILPNTRNNEKDVLNYVIEFKKLLHCNTPMPDDLYNLSVDVNKQHERRSARYYGEFKSRYCSNPWLTISLIAGFLLFVLTSIQTVLSFIQTKYSVLSYKIQELG